MKKTMKKALMMLALLVAPIAMQAQTKFHDVELNECTGPVKSILPCSSAIRLSQSLA